MPETTTVTETPEMLPPVTETVIEPAPPVETPTAVMDPELNGALRDVLDGVNSINSSFEGTTETGPLVLDAEQYGVLIVALSLLIALLACLVVMSMRR